MIARRTCFVLEDESCVGGIQVEHVVSGGARERPDGRLDAKIRHRERVGHVPQPLEAAVCCVHHR